jgi:hypothetical protein
MTQNNNTVGNNILLRQSAANHNFVQNLNKAVGITAVFVHPLPMTFVRSSNQV